MQGRAPSWGEYQAQKQQAHTQPPPPPPPPPPPTISKAVNGPSGPHLAGAVSKASGMGRGVGKGGFDRTDSMGVMMPGMVQGGPSMMPPAPMGSMMPPPIMGGMMMPPPMVGPGGMMMPPPIMLDPATGLPILHPDGTPVLAMPPMSKGGPGVNYHAFSTNAGVGGGPFDTGVQRFSADKSSSYGGGPRNKGDHHRKGGGKDHRKGDDFFRRERDDRRERGREAFVGKERVARPDGGEQDGTGDLVPYLPSGQNQNGGTRGAGEGGTTGGAPADRHAAGGEEEEDDSGVKEEQLELFEDFQEREQAEEVLSNIETKIVQEEQRREEEFHAAEAERADHQAQDELIRKQALEAAKLDVVNNSSTGRAGLMEVEGGAAALVFPSVAEVGHGGGQQHRSAGSSGAFGPGGDKRTTPRVGAPFGEAELLAEGEGEKKAFTASKELTENELLHLQMLGPVSLATMTLVESTTAPIKNTSMKLSDVLGTTKPPGPEQGGGEEVEQAIEKIVATSSSAATDPAVLRAKADKKRLKEEKKKRKEQKRLRKAEKVRKDNEKPTKKLCADGAHNLPKGEIRVLSSTRMEAAAAEVPAAAPPKTAEDFQKSEEGVRKKEAEEEARAVEAEKALHFDEDFQMAMLHGCCDVDEYRKEHKTAEEVERQAAESRKTATTRAEARKKASAERQKGRKNVGTSKEVEQAVGAAAASSAARGRAGSSPKKAETLLPKEGDSPKSPQKNEQPGAGNQGASASAPNGVVVAPAAGSGRTAASPAQLGGDTTDEESEQSSSDDEAIPLVRKQPHSHPEQAFSNVDGDDLPDLTEGADTLGEAPAKKKRTDPLGSDWEIFRMGDKNFYHHRAMRLTQWEPPTFEQMKKSRKKKVSPLPVMKYKRAICKHVRRNKVTIICGETGCGKTTQVPQFLMDDLSIVPKGRYVIVTQPRKIAAITNSERIASERGHSIIGGEVGYQIRFHNKTDDITTRLVFCTTAVVLRRLFEDPALKRCACLIVDEVHERDIHSEFLLTTIRDKMMAGKRKDPRQDVDHDPRRDDDHTTFQALYRRCSHYCSNYLPRADAAPEAGPDVRHLRCGDLRPLF